MSRGYVYILTNPAMPGIVKIGRTNRTPEARALELHQTGVPMPFKVEEYVFSPDCAELEHFVHVDLEACRVNIAREFFAISVNEAVEALHANHRSQILGFVEEFMPGYTVAYEPLHVSEATLMNLSNLTDSHPVDVAMSIQYLKPEDLAEPLRRWQERQNELLTPWPAVRPS